ncbi:hypothetical protein [Embleya sp. NPDC001921]
MSASFVSASGALDPDASDPGSRIRIRASAAAARTPAAPARKPADIALVKASRAASANPWSPEASAGANASEIDSRAFSGAESGIAPV